ncbi:MAG: dihydropteroate synthase [Deltaproteobacteria bacterium]|nr:dihydropteroate synthase [Deltaproteobacteria bacterium]
MRSPIFSRDRVTVVGVLNATPDSFSDGGRFVVGDRIDLDAVVEEALRMQRAGAHVLDVGGESTRPGAVEVPADIEVARVVPILEALSKACELPLSIDTRKSAVARAALAAGAGIVNDVSGGRFDPALLAIVAEQGAWLVLGHLRGTPATMQDAPQFHDVLGEVAEELAASVARAEAAGVVPAQIVVDPGIGFGKRQQDNLALLANAGWLGERLGKPVLVGPSRKAFLGQLTGDRVDQRDVATAAACAIAVFAGADAIRVHDVGAGVRAARIGAALRGARA